MDPIIDAIKDLLDVPVNAWLAGCLGMGAVAVVAAWVLQARVLARPQGSDAMKRAGRATHLALRGFVRVQGTVLAGAAVLGALLLRGVFDAWAPSLAFALGCAAPGAAGVLALRVAAAAGPRTAHAASSRGLGAAVRCAHSAAASGALYAAGLGVAVVAALHLGGTDATRALAFALGASVAALIARVGGGVFAKSADVGMSVALRADQDIPDDDTRNPGVVADDVGDAVVDVSAMGADLVESFAAATLAAATLGAGIASWAERSARAADRDLLASLPAGAATLTLFPVTLFAAGVASALLAAAFVKTENERRVAPVLHRSVMAAAVLVIVGAVALTFTLGLASPEVTHLLTRAGRGAPESWRYDGPAGALWAALVGLFLGIVLGRYAEWTTSEARPPARRLAEESAAGPHANVLQGLALGLTACGWPAAMISVAACVAYFMAGTYGIAVAATGLLSCYAAPLAVHAFGAVAENASGVVEMTRLGPDTRRRTDALDAAAASTGAAGRAYATGAAALTGLALLAAVLDVLATRNAGGAPGAALDLGDVRVQVGLLLGAAVPFLFSSTCIRSVLRVSNALSAQIVESFHAKQPLAESPEAPDHGKFVAAAARRAFRRMGPAAALAIGAPLACAFSPLGARGVAALVAGSLAVSTLTAFTLTASGAAWDNAKRYVASGVFGGKGSPAYRAAVTGDVVGDPLKDVAGPGLHTLVKLMATLALLLLPFLP